MLTTLSLLGLLLSAGLWAAGCHGVAYQWSEVSHDDWAGGYCAALDGYVSCSTKNRLSEFEDRILRSGTMTMQNWVFGEMVWRGCPAPPPDDPWRHFRLPSHAKLAGGMSVSVPLGIPSTLFAAILAALFFQSRYRSRRQKRNSASSVVTHSQD